MASPWPSRVSGWRADFRPAEEQLSTQAERLRTLVGDEVSSTWVVWQLQHDSWFADMPVVLKFRSGVQLEIAWQKFDELSVSWNTIDTDRPPAAWPWFDSFRWRPDGLPELVAAVGRRIKGIAVTSFESETTDVTDPRITNTKDVHSAWLTSGIWFDLGATGLHIYNSLDENAVADAAPFMDQQHSIRSLTSFGMIRGEGAELRDRL